MAHRGREYPRFFRRDLSMKPGGYTYIPDKWEWAGIKSKPGAFVWFDNQINVLDFIGYTNNGRLLTWEKRISFFPSPSYVALRYTYRITQTADMVEQKWLITLDDQINVIIPPVFVTSSFPNNQKPSAFTSQNLGVWDLITTGVFRPKPW